MSLRDTISRGMDWLSEDTTAAAVVSLIKVVVGAGIPIVGGFWLAMNYMDNRENREYNNAFSALDRSQVVTFSSKEQCVAKGYDLDRCQRAIEMAVAWSEQSSTGLRYDSRKTCEDIFGRDACIKEVTASTVTQTNIVIVDNSVIPVITQTPYAIETHKPIVVAVAADARDLSNAVPLYPSTPSGVAIRRDGVAYRLDK